MRHRLRVRRQRPVRSRRSAVSVRSVADPTLDPLAAEGSRGRIGRSIAFDLSAPRSKCYSLRTPSRAPPNNCTIIMRKDGDIGALFATVAEVVSDGAQWHPGRDGDKAHPTHQPTHSPIALCRHGSLALSRFWFRPLWHGRQWEQQGDCRRRWAVSFGVLYIARTLLQPNRKPASAAATPRARVPTGSGRKPFQPLIYRRAASRPSVSTSASART